jgi:lipopolysaccharide export system permease protein
MTLDRYIVRQYLFNVVALLVLLLCFVVTVDVALNIDRFIETASKHTQGQDLTAVSRALLTVGLVFDLWWPRLVQLYNFLLGMVLVGAMGFTLAQLVRHRELVAIMAGGVSLRRVARPILLVALGMTVVQLLNQEFVVPRIAPLLTRDHGDAGRRDLKKFEVPLTADAAGRLFYAKRFDPTTATLYGLRIWERDETGRAARQIAAETATWTGSAWRLESPIVVSLSLSPVDAPPVLSPAPPPASFPPPEGPSGHPISPDTAAAAVPILIPTGLDPAALNLRHYENFSQSLSYSQIGAMLASPNLDQRLHDKLQRVRFGRLSTILSSFLSLVITMPFFLMREPKNMVLQSLKCAPIGLGSLLGGVIGAAAPIPGLPPGLAVFIPVLVLVPIAIATTGSLKT